ncbi:histidine ammonia-lyase (plasmid) [Haloferax mediterranei ATCC 33500]|uniref:Probable histidine ammonia-lyase n=1 Tax=Haloferax mediterranei (strain ATCC 33500 / DSM 1411 / JCM 8866 / NBRC 14739 / NCIMB 2177 / R-4) TaxID=523841 RepID=I3RB43_HALMT|nr:histidine ammonia-lyase [Haloferax mediterranei]AFK21453.1 histidine ammonia-lyase [Haloferax mediterranei ATCC 33500]AHZ24479.1 histidine ammonia-lyase [Haloferax mediterranei ATCC 33500]ELZ97229.1 histidine ammonia-lyase [Haloferax mediterranei ATCC 33500]MDX5990034.1 histidine ammonia-lyase [Haloferax mediterranei ATCC 33500]QCQ76878.1 histidine ammonia-lyase [Haloferax mediterranei ATCC 33500]
MSESALPDTVVVDGESLTPEDVVAVARHDARVELPDEAWEKMQDSRDRVESVLDSGEPVYGVNTGFGHLVETHIDREDIERLQTNLIRSHAAGAGRELTREEVRAMMVTRANTLAKGFSGIRPSVVELLVSMLNEGVHPVVRSRGSLGASGDLAPLAHMALVLIGEGEAHLDGDRLEGDEALDAVGLEPVTLASKEGLALINGTQLTVGLASLFVVDAERTIDAADAAGALTTEVTMGTTANCDPAIHEIRPHPGQKQSAETIRRLTAGSTVLESHKDCERVQDAYSIRCLPQVHGAVRDAVDHLREAVEIELNSVTDNPLVFPAGEVDERAPGTDVAAVVSAGNFHGEPLALRLDYAAGALTELAAISERRTDRMLNPEVQESYLPAFLTEHSGLRSGYMIAQYTAAALLNECRSLGRPSIDSTPVSGGQEDHVSMSGQSVLHAQTVIENVSTIVGVELLCASQAAEFLDDDLELGTGTGSVRDSVRSVVPPLEEDRQLDGELETAGDLVRFGAIRAAVDEALD